MRHVAFGAAAASTLVLFGAACDAEDGFEPGPCDEAQNVDISEQLSDCTILNEGSLYIGALLPLSGMSAEFGVGLQTPINMAVEDVNEVGGIGGQCLGVVLCDTELDNAAGSSNTADRVEELASIDRVIGISGPYTPTDYFSATERIQALEMPLVAVAPFQNMGGSVFNLSPQPMQSTRVIASNLLADARQRSMTNKIAFVAAGPGIARQFVQGAEQAIMSLDTEAEFEVQVFDVPDPTMARATIEEVREFGADFVFLTGVFPVISALITQAEEQSFFPVGLHTIEPSAVLGTATDMRIAEALRGHVPPVGPVESYMPWATRFTMENFESPELTQPGAYDSICLLTTAAALTEDPTDGPALQQAITSGLASGETYFSCSEGLTAANTGAESINLEGVSSSLEFTADNHPVTGYRYFLMSYPDGFTEERGTCTTDMLEDCS